MNKANLLAWSLAALMATGLLPVLRSRRVLLQTTLSGAWLWTFVATVAWTLLAALRPMLATTPWQSHGHYLASVLAMCPFVAVLGARLPGARVWNAVVFTLLLVLAMPCLQASFGPFAPHDVSLDAAWTFFVVGVLSVGLLNYLPTRYAPAVVLYGVGQGSHLIPLSVLSGAGQGEWLVQGSVASVAMTAAIWVARFRALEPIARQLPEDRLWIAFRDLYGLVWGRRQQDRYNAVAAREGWPLRLTWLGMRLTEKVASATPSSLAAVQRKSLETLRYQLRRFVETKWMDEHAAL